MKQVFRDIYASDAWGGGSGPGSFPEATQHYRIYLQFLMRDLGVRSVVDIGCGDWQLGRLLDWSGIDYLGVDIVPEVIGRNQAAFGQPKVNFLCADVTEDAEALPKADLLLIKDVLQHLPNGLVYWTLNNVLPRFRYALITNCVEPDSDVNRDIEPGGFRPLRLEREPFSVRGETVLRFSSPDPDLPWTKHSLLVRQP